MLLLNHRGFSSFVACRACGERVECANCSVTLTFHRRDRRMLCHYCNYSERVPERCPKCDSEYLQFMGLGSERVEAELNGGFPKARIARLDRDAINGKRDYETILVRLSRRRLRYPRRHADSRQGPRHSERHAGWASSAPISGLGLPDFRAAERTFQLLDAGGRTR